MALLAHLYPHIRGSQEDIATYSLQYILSASSELNHAFTRLISEALHCDVPDTLNYVCQSVGDSQERPDMAGINADGKETVLCEAKFYAGLTDNQPNTYLDRLVQEHATGLVFICPEVRKQALWRHLLELVEERNIVEQSEFCVSVDGALMSIVTWGEVVSALKSTAASAALKYVSDVEQLEGFCRQMDSDAFIPFSAEDIGPDVARKEDRYYRVVDELIEFLKSDKSLNPSTKGVKATAYRRGYGRAVNARGYWVCVNYDRDLWTNPSTCETPFWVAIREGSDWKQHDYILRAFKRFPEADKESMWNLTYLALRPMLNGTLDEVVRDMKAQIMKYIDAVEEERPTDGPEA